MKYVMLCWLVFLLGACASNTSSYRAAKPDGTGYKEIALDSTSYRVQFKTRGNQRTTAHNYALQRAAELTLNAGYDWFIVSKETRRLINEGSNSPQLPETITTHRCGLLGCKTQTHQAPDLDIERQESYTVVLMDIHMGRGIRPEKNSYDAQETWGQLSAKK
ncbi:CC0125/CC1285 family lipoprotein [Cellvibrio mixtus]|uniref:CC0125/CC1285 family lipoprotein n=1 Tax=Cellvibrio mixtus TaxID=39650 RepID=UPI000586BF1A|nr:hypothetical protein [Cellvibrio mixtus]